MTPPRETPDDIPALVQRLEALAHRYDMTHAERYEADSEAFYAASGFMAPGKDVPMAMGGQNEQERRAAHEAWIAGRNMEQQYAIRDAAVALAQLPSLLAAETSQREAAERALEAVTERIMRALVDGTRESLTANGLNDALDLVRRIADGGRAWRDTAGREHARLTAALTEAQRERDDAAARAFDNEMLGRVTMGRVMALEAERDRLTAALTEAQRRARRGRQKQPQ